MSVGSWEHDCRASDREHYAQASGAASAVLSSSHNVKGCILKFWQRVTCVVCLLLFSHFRVQLATISFHLSSCLIFFFAEDGSLILDVVSFLAVYLFAKWNEGNYTQVGRDCTGCQSPRPAYTDIIPEFQTARVAKILSYPSPTSARKMSASPFLCDMHVSTTAPPFVIGCIWKKERALQSSCPAISLTLPFFNVPFRRECRCAY